MFEELQHPPDLPDETSSPGGKGLRRMGSVKKQPFFMSGVASSPSNSPTPQNAVSQSPLNPFSSWYTSNSLGSYYNAMGFSKQDIKHVFPDLRVQLVDQLKVLDSRLDTQVQLTNEIQEFFKKRAEVELETSKALDKLAKNLNTRHKEIKAKRDSSVTQTALVGSAADRSSLPWSLFNSQSSLSVCWQQLINDTKIQSQNHAILADIYSTEITQRLQFVSEDLQRIYKQCREIGLEAHEELLKVLHELHTSNKTYHTYQIETRVAEAKLKLVEAQKSKLEQQIPKEKLDKSKKMKIVEKEVQKRTHKFTDARFKSQKAKNEYILCMDAANAAVQKYFMEDLSDLIDCMDLGFYECVTRSLNMYVSSQDQIRKSLNQNMENMSKCISSLDARLDKQKFLESHNSVFALPKKFEYTPPTYPYNKNTASINEEDFTSDPPEIETSGFIRQELDQRLYALHKRLDTLRIESDELWKTLETAENSLLEMITAKDYDTCAFFVERNRTVNEVAVNKMRSDKQETDEFHLNKFRDYMLTMNRISRLQSKYEHIRVCLKSSDAPVPSSNPSAALAASTRAYNRRKRIGQIQKFTNTRLFGGSIEEYLEKTNQDIPLIMKSCVRVINLFGLHHQGIFRVSGSQVEINNFKEAFEKGEDPLADVNDASDINSVAGVLKLYFRELREPLFPICYFEQFMELAQLDSNGVFITRMRDLVKSLPKPVFIVLRYLFAFLNHLSEYSDENMMDPYNLAICFGPTLVPVPEDKDQVQYQNLVNELIKNVILFHDEIFVDIPDGIFYEKYINNHESQDDHNRSVLESSSPVLKTNTHSTDDSSSLPCSSVLSEEVCVSLPLPPVSPVIKETVIIDDDEDYQIGCFKQSDYLEAIAQFDFNARSTRELSLKKGETLVLYAQVSSDWWKGANKNKDEGLIPDKYILLKIRDEELPVESKPTSTPPPEKQKDKQRIRTQSDSLLTSPLAKLHAQNNEHQRSLSVSEPATSAPTSVPEEIIKPVIVEPAAEPEPTVQVEEATTSKTSRSALAPDLVMDLPAAEEPVVPPIPPNFTDTSSSEEESDSSESSSSSIVKPDQSGAEVFAKQKNATLKKRSQAEAKEEIHRPNERTMFSFTAQNKPQVKVKPVVLSKPKLPREFTLNKMDEEQDDDIKDKSEQK